MKWTLRLILLVFLGDMSAEGNAVQAANPGKLSPYRRAAVEERCHRIRRDCIATGDIFKRSVVCGGGGKRFINECALQLRSCDLLLETGEEILQERCFWVELPDTEVSSSVSYFTTPAATTARTTRIVYDYFGWFSSPTSEGAYTSVTTGVPSTSERLTTPGYELFSTTNKPSTEEPSTTTNELTTVSSSITGLLKDHGGITIPHTVGYFSYWPTEFTTGESGGFRPPDALEGRTCCRGDTPCKSCLRKHKGGEVCGSDGKTYDTECALDNYACDNSKEELVVAHLGSCEQDYDYDFYGNNPHRGDLGKR